MGFLGHWKHTSVLPPAQLKQAIITTAKNVYYITIIRY